MPSDTTARRILPGDPNEKGWRPLQFEAGEPYVGEPVSADAKPLLNLIHLSDLHICDAQSPARVEILDRYADPHHPMSELVKYVGTYRAQEIMTAQTLEAMVRTVNAITEGPLSKRPIDAVVVTGDVTDNAQQNELSWYLTLMDGGQVRPDSGNLTKWEGAATKDPSRYDRSYWNPEGTPSGCEDDFPRSLYGFPEVPGLTDAVRQPFEATGLAHTWFATHGNHDALLQGTVPADEVLIDFALGSERVVSLPSDVDLAGIFENFQQVGPVQYLSPDGATLAPIQADERRKFNEPDSWAKLHLGCGHGHGLQPENAAAGTKYWYRDIGAVRLVSMDTVNHHGGWQGSLDETQFAWLKQVLSESEPKYFVLLSHHPAPTLFNLYAPEGAERRIGEEELAELVVSNPRVVLWLAGHNHEHHIDYVGNAAAGTGFWHIQTASNIDWPQQGRVVELFEEDGSLAIATSVFDHLSPISLEEATSDLSNPVHLAGLSRLLSANDWQRRTGEFAVSLMAGEVADRNRVLRLNRA